MPKAYSYIRMSTENQLKGDSLRRQVEKSTLFAKENGLELDTTFSLRDIGYSAFDGSNVAKGELGKFLTAVRLGKIERGSTLIVESLDRLSRQHPMPALQIFLSLLENGISIATLIDKRIFHPDANPQDFMFSLGVLIRAHEESVVKSDRVSEAWNEKRKRIGTEILTSRCVAWVEPKKDRTGFEVLENRAAIVRRIFDEASDKGIGADLIARRLNREKIAPFGRANGWHKSYVLKILTNRAVLGEFKPCSRNTSGVRTECEVVKGYYPSVVDENTFYRAQSAMARRKQIGAGRKGERVANLFTGLLVCGVCLGNMHYLNKGAKGGRILICDNARRGLGCYKVSWRYEDFEQTFLTYVSKIDIKSFFKNDKAQEVLSAVRNELNELDGRLATARGHRDRVFKLILGDEPTEYLRAKLRDLDAEVAELTDQLGASNNALSQALQEHRDSTNNKADILALINKIQSDHSDEITMNRLAIAARLKQLINEILLFPGGALPSAEELRKALGREDVDQIIQMAEVSKSERSMMVDFKDGTFTMINPDELNPARANYLVTDEGYKIKDGVLLAS